MGEITILHYLVLSALLFALGLMGMVIRKNLLIVFMCIEVLMNAINLLFVALARYFQLAEGHSIAIIVMAIAAVEAAIGLGLIITIFRQKQSVKTSDFSSMWG